MILSIFTNFGYCFDIFSAVPLYDVDDHSLIAYLKPDSVEAADLIYVEWIMDKQTLRHYKTMDPDKIFSLWWGPHFQGYTTCYYHIGNCAIEWKGATNYRVTGLQENIFLKTVKALKGKNLNGEDALIYIPPLVRFSRGFNYIKEKDNNAEAETDEKTEQKTEENEDDNDCLMDGVQDGIKNMMNKPEMSSNHNRNRQPKMYGQRTPAACKPEKVDDAYNWHQQNREQMEFENDGQSQSWAMQ